MAHGTQRPARRPLCADPAVRAQSNVDEALRDLRARGIEAVGCAAHVGAPADLERLAALARDSYGRVDALVSNAAVNPAAGLILDMPDSAIDKVLDINVKAAITLCRAVRPLMREARTPARHPCALAGQQRGLAGRALCMRHAAQWHPCS